MRARLFLLLLPAALAGCAGNVADYIGPRSDIIARELTRYGLNIRQTECVGERLGASLTPLQLRRFERAASSVRQGYFDPDRLTLRDLMHVAGSMGEPQVRLELARAAAGCGAGEEVVASRGEATPSLVPGGARPGTLPPPFGAPAAPAPPPTWLNLGAASSGQAIAVDAGSVERRPGSGKAWFRLVNPDTPPSGISYLLQIDCAARTIAAIARRTHDSAGTMTEYREYGPPDSNPGPVEGGTVMEIAYLSICT